jgi:hypothetical protein
MFRVTSLLGLAGAVVAGLIVADLITHPNGTRVAGNTLISLEKNTGNQLIGKAA